MELLEFINVNKQFGNKKVLKDINLKIPRGKIIGLLGKNGGHLNADSGYDTFSEILKYI